MRKIIAFTVLLMVAVSAYLGAEWRYYESSHDGYSGNAVAYFNNNVIEQFPETPLDLLGRIDKVL